MMTFYFVFEELRQVTEETEDYMEDLGHIGNEESECIGVENDVCIG